MRDGSCAQKSVDGLHDMLRFIAAGGSAMEKMVEVGTYIGESAAVFSTAFKTVYTVDPWDMGMMAMYGTEVTEDEVQSLYEQTTKDCKNIHHIQKPSVLASTMFSDKSLDFVYIDGWHRVLPVMADILSWLPKVKNGGFIGGHDYIQPDGTVEVMPVVRAFFLNEVRVFSDTSWLVRLPTTNPNL